MNKICCFAGHRDIYDSDDIYSKLITEIEKLITQHNVTEFWVGNYGRFDSLAARAVMELKSKYPHIQLSLVIPYITEKINEYKEQYYKMYDNIIMANIPEGTPIRLRIIKCNEYIIAIGVLSEPA